LQLLHHSSIILRAQHKQAWSTEHSECGIGSILSKTKGFNWTDGDYRFLWKQVICTQVLTFYMFIIFVENS
jgi:hypothetical protein